MDILNIANKNGRFNVSLRWRDIPLQKECNALVKEGKLVKVGRIKREIVYLPAGTEYEISKGGYLNIKGATK